jgi:predicted ATP pyrophosphatase (TIGR00289 family)
MRTVKSVNFMQAAVLASGGKDSTLALYRILEKGYEVKYLVSMVPIREDSWMFHYPNIHLIDLYAEAVGFPLIKGETVGVKEKEVEDLKHLIKKLKIDTIVSGAIASNYQKTRIEKICEELKLECLTPLWHEDPLNMMKEMLRLDFEIIITGVYAYGFNEKWLGQKIDKKIIEALIELNKKYSVSIVGEGGEYETLVLDACFFKKRIKIIDAEINWKKQSGYFIISKASLEEK